MFKNNRSLLWAGAGLGAFLAAKTLLKKYNAYSFRNKVVIVTGGSRGLGLVLSRMLAKEGAHLAICSRTEYQLKTAAEELEQYGTEIFAVNCDLTDRLQAESFIKQVLDRFGRIDVLINNAGIIQAGPLETMVVDDFADAMNIHFWAPLYTMLAAVPAMKARGEGRIVNIASVGGRISLPHIVPYSASKFALVGLSEGFRSELQKDGIVVTTVNPGLFRSGSVYNIKVKGQTEKEYAWFTTLGSNLITSSSTEETARRILKACRYGEAEVITNFPAKFLALSNSVLPELTADIMALTNKYILPAPENINQEKQGIDSDSDLIPEHLRERAAKAAEENNEL